jgi:hypothetical protein
MNYWLIIITITFNLFQKTSLTITTFHSLRISPVYIPASLFLTPIYSPQNFQLGGIPIAKMLKSEQEKLLNLEAVLSQHGAGQEEVIWAIPE